MQELRLLGVHQDEQHVLLVAANGAKYQLAIDDSLRAAIRRVPPRKDATENQAAPTISPREIQAQIRAGATAEHIADSADLPLEHVQRYEGPVLAERAHICQMARQQQVRGDFHEGPPRLGELIEDRLATREVHEPGTWDSWRLDDGSWIVQLEFTAGGRNRKAQWNFRPSRAHLEPLDDESRWFVSPMVEAADPPVASNPAFHVQTDNDPTPRSITTTAEPSFASTDELLEHLQTQRSERAEAVTPADAVLDAQDPYSDLPPAAHPARTDLHVVAPVEVTSTDPNPAAVDLTESPEPAEVDLRDESTEQLSASAKPAPPAKGRRNKVPSWDEIMFGSRKD